MNEEKIYNNSFNVSTLAYSSVMIKNYNFKEKFLLKFSKKIFEKHYKKLIGMYG